jgi:hypothetical protein
MSNQTFKLTEPMKNQLGKLLGRVRDDQRNFEQSRDAFNEFLGYVKAELGVPTDKPYQLSPDLAEFFFAINLNDAGPVVTEKVDQTDACTQPADVTGA